MSQHISHQFNQYVSPSILFAYFVSMNTMCERERASTAKKDMSPLRRAKKADGLYRDNILTQCSFVLTFVH